MWVHAHGIPPVSSSGVPSRPRHVQEPDESPTAAVTNIRKQGG